MIQNFLFNDNRKAPKCDGNHSFSDVLFHSSTASSIFKFCKNFQVFHAMIVFNLSSNSVLNIFQLWIHVWPRPDNASIWNFSNRFNNSFSAFWKVWPMRNNFLKNLQNERFLIFSISVTTSNSFSTIPPSPTIRWMLNELNHRSLVSLILSQLFPPQIPAVKSLSIGIQVLI